MKCVSRILGHKAFAFAIYTVLSVAGCCARAQNLAKAKHRAATAQKIGVEPVVQALTHVTVVNPLAGTDEQQDMTILIRDSTIVAVEKSTRIRLRSGTIIHNEQGR